MAGFLKGAALTWFEPILRNYIDNKKNDRNDSTNKIFKKFANFEEAIKGAFGEPNEKLSNEQRIVNLKQIRSAATYMAVFQQAIA